MSQCVTRFVPRLHDPSQSLLKLKSSCHLVRSCCGPGYQTHSTWDLVDVKTACLSLRGAARNAPSSQHGQNFNGRQTSKDRHDCIQCAGSSSTSEDFFLGTLGRWRWEPNRGDNSCFSRRGCIALSWIVSPQLYRFE